MGDLVTGNLQTPLNGLIGFLPSRTKPSFELGKRRRHDENADRAFEWLEKERGNGGTFAEIVVDPIFGNLYDDPRWLPFLRSIGKAPEQLAKVSFSVSLPK